MVFPNIRKKVFLNVYIFFSRIFIVVFPKYVHFCGHFYIILSSKPNATTSRYGNSQYLFFLCQRPPADRINLPIRISPKFTFKRVSLFAGILFTSISHGWFSTSNSTVFIFRLFLISYLYRTQSKFSPYFCIHFFVPGFPAATVFFVITFILVSIFFVVPF